MTESGAAKAAGPGAGPGDTAPTPRRRGLAPPGDEAATLDAGVGSRLAALAVALVEAAASLTLLAVSVWFIGACAAAGHFGAAAGFNYVAPATLIRALAILRIGAGYGGRYLGHRVLLARLAALRQRVMAAVFAGAAAPTQARAAALLQQACERRAATDSAVLAPQLAALLQLSGLLLFLGLLLPRMLAPWLAICALLLALRQGLAVLVRRAVARREAAQRQLDDGLQRWLAGSSLWTLREDWADGSEVAGHAATFARQRRGIDALLQDAECLLLLLGVALAALLLTLHHPLPGQAVAAVPVLLAAALRDWLRPAVGAPAAAQEARLAAAQLPAAPEQLAAGTAADRDGNAAARGRELRSTGRATARIEGRDGTTADAASAAVAQATAPPAGSAPPGAAAAEAAVLLLQRFQWQRGARRGTPLSASLRSPGLVLLAGPSGVGKSSLLLALSGELPARGRALWHGRDLAGLDAAQRVRLTYHGEQFARVLSDTLAHNLRLAAPEADEAQLRAALDWADVGELLRGPGAGNGLAQWLGEHGRALSGGERKRLVLARAWLSQAPIWFLDEPFEGLDAPRAEALAGKLNSVARERLLLVASHLRPQTLAPTRGLTVGGAAH